VNRNYAYRLYPNRRQAQLLDRVLEIHRQLYNAALQERRDAWRMCRVSLNYCAQANQLKAIRQFDQDSAWLNYSSIQQTLRRLDKAFAAFFRRIRAGDQPGYPRFKSKRRFNSVQYRWGDGIRLKANRLHIQNVGTLKVKWHRPLPENATGRTGTRSSRLNCPMPRPRHTPVGRSVWMLACIRWWRCRTAQ
jgi:putative transposase